MDRELYSDLCSACAEEIVAGKISEDPDVLAIIERRVFELVDVVEEFDTYIKRIYGAVHGILGSLSYLLDDCEVCEIMANGPDNVFVERKSEIIKLDIGFDSKEEMLKVIRRIASTVHREVSELSPILDARLEDGSRVHAVMDNVAIGGPSLTIRRFGDSVITMEQLIRGGTLTAECARDLKSYAQAGINIFVSGGTSSGKTTMLNAIGRFIPQNERAVVIEDSMELKLDGIGNIVRLECRQANSTGRGKITMNDLIRASLRMRPDRIIVGEVRGSEVCDMLQALNTGHSGMSTGHGNSIRGMLRRIEAMYLSGSDMPLDAVRMQIVEAFQIMVHVQRTADGRRWVTEMKELCGFKDGEYVLTPLYERGVDGVLIRTGRELSEECRAEMRLAI